MDTTLVIQLVVVGLIVLMVIATVRARSSASKAPTNQRRMGAAALVVLSGLFSSNVVDPVEQAKVTMVREHDGENEDPDDNEE